MGYRRQKNTSWFCVFESQSYLKGVPKRSIGFGLSKTGLIGSICG